MTFDNMYLYIKPGCPFCARVDRFLDNAGVQIEHRDITQGGNRDDLVALGGKGQVPCLIVEGEPMYESMDIINYINDLVSAK